MRASERKKRHRETVTTADLVEHVLHGYNLSEHTRRCRILVEWSNVVGASNAARTWPGALHDGVLHVRVANSSWLHQLSFLREDITRRLNEVLGDPPMIQEIRFHLGARARDESQEPGPTSMRRPARRRRPRPTPASGPELAAIEAETRAIEDPELRAVVADARRKLRR